MSSSGAVTKSLYVTIEDEDATCRLPFIPGETTAALTQRALGAAEINPYLPFAYRASVSLDGGATFANNTKLCVTEYPKRGDVPMKIQKRAPRIYVHQLPSDTTIKNIGERFCDPTSTECVDVKSSTPADGTTLSRSLLRQLMSSSSNSSGKNNNNNNNSETTTMQKTSFSSSIFARPSADGEFTELKPDDDSASFGFFPWNGDVFVAAAAEDSSSAKLITPADIDAVLKKGELLTKHRRFGAAIELYRSLLEMMIEASGGDEQLQQLPIWHQLGIVYGEGAGLHDKAADAFRKCLSISRGLLLRLRPNDNVSSAENKKRAVMYASNLAKELFLAERYRDAANVYQETFDLAARNDVSLSNDVTKDLRIRMGATLYKAGAKPQGMQMVQEALAGDTSNDLGLFWMSKFYAEMDHDADALQWAATLLLKKNEDKDYRLNFAELVASIPDSIDVIKTKIVTGASPKHAQVWCYFGLVMSDQGYLSLAKQFYEVGIAMDESNASFALNYIHVLEHMNKLGSALAYCRKFLEKRGDVKLGMNKHFGPTPATVAKLLLHGCGGGGGGGGCVALASAAPSFPFTHAIRMMPPPPPSSSSSSEQLGEFSHIKIYPDILAVVVDDTTKDEVEKKAGLGSDDDAKKSSSGATSRSEADAVPCVWQTGKQSIDTRPKQNALITEDDVNIAGIYFTSVKLLFAMGALDNLPQLIYTINPLRLHQQFHETKVKNEHSYFTTVSLAIQYLTSPTLKSVVQPPSSSASSSSAAAADTAVASSSGFKMMSEFLSDPKRCIYYVGDSHSVPCSWHQVSILNKKSTTAGGGGGGGGSNTAEQQQHERRLIVNKLVTGLKVWHLRPEGSFYPKRQFENVVGTLPQGADVIFNFGEIDCREAALRVVEKGLYETTEQCYEHLAKIYIQALLDAKRLRRLGRVAVLGPLPVLEATRHLVVSCNKVFARVFGASKDVAANRIVFLDACDWVLQTDASSSSSSQQQQPAQVAVKGGESRVLKEEFCFDNTHIHPSFVEKVLEPMLNSEVFV